MILSPFDKQLCEQVQLALPLTERPFATLGASLDADEDKVLFRLQTLLKEGVITRLGLQLNPLALGRAVTLVASSVPEEQIHWATEILNSQEWSSDLTLRDHHYNLWFQLEGPDMKEVERTLAELGAQCSLGFHSLPALWTFKDQDYLAITGQARASLNTRPGPQSKVDLSEEEKQLLRDMQGDWPLRGRLFDAWATPQRPVGKVLSLTQGLLDRGVIRRCGAQLNPRPLGYQAQALWACRIPDHAIEEVGLYTAGFGCVRSVHHRQAFADWRYNLYVTLQARRSDEIQQTTQQIGQHFGIRIHEHLPMIQAFSRGPNRYPIQ